MVERYDLDEIPPGDFTSGDERWVGYHQSGSYSKYVTFAGYCHIIEESTVVLADISQMDSSAFINTLS